MIKTRTNRLVRRMGAKMYKHGSGILTGGAILLFGATVVFVAKGQMKADDILAERDRIFESGEDENSEVEVIPSKREIFDLTWKCYIPAGITGVLTIVCIIGSHYISWKQIAGLTAALGFMTKNRNQLEQAIREKYGDEALEELKTRVKSVMAGDGVRGQKEVVMTPAEPTGKGGLLCFEGYSGRWFRSSEEAVREALEELQRAIKSNEYVSMNEFYDLLGIENTHFGFEYGWLDTEWDSVVDEGDMPIRYEVNRIFEEAKGEDVLWIDIYTYPIEHYYEY